MHSKAVSNTTLYKAEFLVTIQHGQHKLSLQKLLLHHYLLDILFCGNITGILGKIQQWSASLLHRQTTRL